MRSSLFLAVLLSLAAVVFGQAPSTCPSNAQPFCVEFGTDSVEGDLSIETANIYYLPTGKVCGITATVQTATASYTNSLIDSTPVLTRTPAQTISTINNSTGTFITFSIGFSLTQNSDPTKKVNVVLSANQVLAGVNQVNNPTVLFSFSLNQQTDLLSTFQLGLFCKAPALTVGDPQFVGLRGQSYQIHGVDGSVYNIISDKNLQVNSKFVFLTEGVCPMFDGVADVNCWSHPGSYMGEMSFQAKVDGKLHAALLTSGGAKQGFAAIQMDGKNVKVGEQVTFGAFSLTAVNSHKVVISTEQFSFELTNSDMFINQALTPKVALSKMTAHGLLGQTHSAKTYPNAIKFIQGEVDDYTIADNDIFGDDFVYNQFKA